MYVYSMQRRERVGASIVKFSHSRSTVRDLINTISLTFVATYRARPVLSLTKMSLLARSSGSFISTNLLLLTTCIILFSLLSLLMRICRSVNVKYYIIHILFFRIYSPLIILTFFFSWKRFMWRENLYVTNFRRNYYISSYRKNLFLHLLVT